MSRHQNAAMATLVLVLCSASVSGQQSSKNLMDNIASMDSARVFFDSGFTDPTYDICLRAGASRIVTKSDTTICFPKETFAIKTFVGISTMNSDQFNSMLELNKNAVSHGLFLDLGRGSVPLVDLTIRMERIRDASDSTTERIHWLDKRQNLWYPVCTTHSFDRITNTATATIPREVLGGINFSIDNQDTNQCASAAAPACAVPAGVLAIFETNTVECSESVPNKIAADKVETEDDDGVGAGSGIGRDWSSGEIAGLVIGLIVGLAILGCITYYCCCIAPKPKPVPRALPDNTQYPVPYIHQTHVYTQPATEVIVQKVDVPVAPPPPPPVVQTTQIVQPAYAPPRAPQQTIRLTKHIPLHGAPTVTYRQ